MKFKAGTLMCDMYDNNNFGLKTSKALSLKYCNGCYWKGVCSRYIIIFHFSDLQTHCCYSPRWKEYSNEI